MVGKKLQAPFKDYLRQQKEKLHRKPGESVPTVRLSAHLSMCADCKLAEEQLGPGLTGLCRSSHGRVLLVVHH